MNSTTLRGVFPEPKPVCKRNFIKENVKHIRTIQTSIHSANEVKNQNMKKVSSQKQIKANEILPRKSTSANHTSVEVIERLLERGVQTEKNVDVKELYKSGVIKYPSPHLMTTLTKRNYPKKCGDGQDEILNKSVDECDKTEANGKHNFVKENMMALKRTSLAKEEQKNNSTEFPMHYQKGALPKYLQQRKEELNKAVQPECPEGHVLLSDEERKATLKVLRQFYADRIQELNSMPVRNDTLRMHKRKMELEDELKKIDEGIKVFQRPKVFVKTNA